MRQYTIEFSNLVRDLKEKRLYRHLLPQSPNGFDSNDYLGLREHEALREAAASAARRTSGSGGSRLLGGNDREHEAAEEEIAQWFRAPAAVFFSSGYLANIAAVGAAAMVVPSFLSDERNHASLIDGLRLSGKSKQIVPHQAWDKVAATGAGRGILAESLYGMDGDLVDEQKLRALCAADDSFLVLDEAHAAGVLREDGRGVGAAWRDWDRTIVVVTFGKAFGAGGAAVLCSAPLKEWIVSTGRTFLFTTAPPPSVPAAVRAALRILDAEPERRQELWGRAERLRTRLREAVGPLGRALATPRGDVWSERSPVVPILLSGEERALRFAESMRSFGWPLRAIRFPTVPRGAERIRISLSLATSRERTEAMTEELVRQWTEFS